MMACARENRNFRAIGGESKRADFQNFIEIGIRNLMNIGIRDFMQIGIRGSVEICVQNFCGSQDSTLFGHWNSKIYW
jgi:hypothetical protein